MYRMTAFSIIHVVLLVIGTSNISVNCLLFLNDVDNDDDIVSTINIKNQFDHHRYVFLEDDINASTLFLAQVSKGTSSSNSNIQKHHRTLTDSKKKNDSKKKTSSRKVSSSSKSLINTKKVNTDFLNSEKDLEDKIRDNHHQTSTGKVPTTTTKPTTKKVVKKKKKKTKSNDNNTDSDLIRDHRTDIDTSHKLTKPPTLRQPVQQPQPVRQKQPGPRQPAARQPVLRQPRQPNVGFSTKRPSTNGGGGNIPISYHPTKRPSTNGNGDGKGNIPISYHPITTTKTTAPARQQQPISSTKSPSIVDMIGTSPPTKDDEQSNESIIPTISSPSFCISTQQSLEYAINQLPNISTTSIVERRRTTETTTWNTTTTTLYLCPTNIIISSMIDIRYKSFTLDCYNNMTSSTSSSLSPCVIMGLRFNRLFRIGYNSNITYQNIHFINSQFSFGSVMYIRHDSYIKLIQCNFYNNTSFDAGGVLYIDSNSILYIDNCIFISNYVTRGVGGVIYTINTNNITIMNSLFESNIANKTGGAIFVDKLSTIMISNTKFLNNTAHIVGGGAITIEGSSRVDLYNSTIFVNNIISTNITDGNAISLTQTNNTESSPYLSCDDSIIFCNGMDSISGILDGITNCLSNGIQNPLPESCQV